MLRRLLMLRGLLRQYAGTASILVVIGFLWVGLEPFEPYPENVVSWLGNENGLRIRRGTVLGPADSDPDVAGACTLEVWFRPAGNPGGRVLLAFFEERPPYRFLISQYANDALWFRRLSAGGIENWLLERDLPWGTRILLTFVSDGSESRVYFDGELVEASPRIAVTQADCGDRFVMGTGPTSDAIWNGDLLGLAIYASALAPDQVADHFRAWESGSAPDPTAEPDLRALYVFDEGAGDVVRDKTGHGRDLSIPPFFDVPVRSFLERPGWVQIRTNDLDWPDIFVNVAGFAPFGFFFAAFLVARGYAGRVAMIGAVSGGLLVSLTIESLQFLLPTRTSSMTDLATNVLGAGLGAWLSLRLVGPPEDAQKS